MIRLHDTLEYQAREHPDTVFATMGNTTISYAEADRDANRLANALIAEGLEPGDRVAFVSKNSIEHAVFYYGASKAGVVPVPLNYRLAAPEWSFIAGDAQAKLLIAQPEFTAGIDQVRDDLAGVSRFLSVGGDVQGWDSYGAFVAGGGDARPDRDVHAAADVYQMYTSGTTGRPKGAVIQHCALGAQLHQAQAAFGLEAGDRSLIVAPLYHAAAAVAAFVTVQAGGTLFIQEDFVPADVVRALADEKIGLALLVPAMIQFCLVAVPDVAERDYGDLKTIVYGASPISEAVLRQALDVFDCGFLQGYGMTETTAAATYLMPSDHDAALAGRPELLLSAGRPLLATEIRIVDDADRPLSVGELGEVCIRGPQVMRGYWNRPEATEEALAGGWMHTGDAGRLDADGYLFIQDRVKDMIVSGGENVYPREIEEVLFSHDAVADVAVIGIPDEKWGEAVLAFVVKAAGAEVTADELFEYCRAELAGYKQPRRIEFIDELPRNPSGKVLKKDLREPFWKGHDRRVG